MTDADDSLQPYSDDWLRQRGAKFNPLTGVEVAEPRLVEEAEPSGEKPTPVDEPDKVLPPGRDGVNGGGGAVGSVHPSDKEDAGGGSETSKVSSSKSKLPVLIGLVLAIAAVVAAEHYLVPMFTHAAPAGPVKQLTRSSGPLTSETDRVATAVPAPPEAAIARSSQQSNSSTVVATANKPALTTTPNVESTTPVQATSVQPKPPTMSIAKSSVVPRVQESYPAPAIQTAPAQHHSESNAHYEQQHLNQLMSPLG